MSRNKPGSNAGLTLTRRQLLSGGLAAAAAWPTARGAASGAKPAESTVYAQIRWIDEREDPSLTVETDELVARVIDNTGLRPRPGAWWMEQNYSHHLGYHGIRALWNRDERRNIVAPFFSWLSLQGLQVEHLELDPVDSRARAGVGRGWPMTLKREDGGALLQIPRRPVSGIEYDLRITPSGPDSLDFSVRFTLHKKGGSPAKLRASWPCYMSTFDEVALYYPVGDPKRPRWESFGQREPFVLGEPVNYVHSQQEFRPARAPAFPAVFGQIGSRVLAIMVSDPRVEFFLVNAGGHIAYLPVQNPAWDFSLTVPDYEPGRPVGFRGRILYKTWEGEKEITRRYHAWRREVDES